MNADVIVIGGGISGLTTAYYLKQRGMNVRMLESDARTGGKIYSERDGGYLLEFGPNSLRLENRETADLIDALALRQSVVPSSAAAKHRFVARGGALVALPGSPGSFLRSDLLSAKGKFALLSEPFRWRSSEDDETLDQFFARRIGREAVERLVDPFVRGIYAGDVRSLSVRSAFPQLWEAERSSGSIFRGMWRNRKAKLSTIANALPRIFSFEQGLQTLADALRHALGDSVVASSRVSAIHKLPTGFEVKSHQSFTAPRLILCTPARETASLVTEVAPEAATALEEIAYAPIAVVHLAFEREAVQSVAPGFGFLVPSIEKRNILGCIYSSTLFPGRAPDGAVLFTVLLGGASAIDPMKHESNDLLRLALHDLQDLFRTRETPLFSRVTKWERAIPQYRLGHHRIIQTLENAENIVPRLHFQANYRNGISVGSCIRNAAQLAERITLDDQR